MVLIVATADIQEPGHAVQKISTNSYKGEWQVFHLSELDSFHHGAAPQAVTWHVCFYNRQKRSLQTDPNEIKLHAVVRLTLFCIKRCWQSSVE